MFKRSIQFLIVIVTMSYHVSAQIADNTALTPNPAVINGRLDNGLTYFIQENHEPKGRVFMYLVVRAGSILEDESQRGLAHFVEHMAFNGTEHFPKNEMLDYLQKQGVRFGADINAYTSYEETVYKLPIPSDNAELMVQGLQILRDWAGGILFDQEELEAERGVILAEKLQRGGLGERIQQQTMPVTLNKSRYIDRMPIGIDEVIKGFKREEIVRFYQDWYRPDLQAVIIVGDIDAQSVERDVRKQFADLNMPANPRPRETYPIPLLDRQQFVTATDAEVQEPLIQVLYKRAEEKFEFTPSAIRSSLVRSITSSLIAGRFSEISRKANPPFRSAGAQAGSTTGGLTMFNVHISPHQDQVAEGFVAAMTEVERIRRHGFTAGELDRAIIRQLSSLDAFLAESDKRSSNSLAESLQNAFLNDMLPSPAPAVTIGLQKQLLPTITLDELQAQANLLFDDRNRDMVIVSADEKLASLPDEASFVQLLATVKQSVVEPYQDIAVGRELIKSLPTAGKITSTSALSGLDATVWTLSNGARVVFKTTDFKNDEVVILASSPGGVSLYDDSLSVMATNAASLVSSFGVGDYNNIDLPKVLVGKQVGFRVSIGERQETISGGSSSGDLKTAMELMYLYFTAPRKDTALFRKTIDQSVLALARKYTNPDAIYQDSVTAILSNYHPRRSPLTKDQLSAMDLDKLVEIYRERFADAADFTFYFVGNIQEEVLKPLVEQYIASLPTQRQPERARDLGIRPPKGHVNKVVYAGKEDKANVLIYLHGDRDSSRTNELSLRALGDIIGYRLLERLREQEGGIYSPSVQMSIIREPVAMYGLQIQFQCKPDDVEKLKAATFEELEKLSTSGIPADDLAKFKAEYARSQEPNARSNNYWLNYLKEVTEGAIEADDRDHLDERIQALTADSLHDAALRYLDSGNAISIVRLPEE